MPLKTITKLGSIGTLAILMVAPVFAGPQDDGLWSQPFEFEWPIDNVNTFLTPQGDILSIGSQRGSFNDYLTVDVWSPELGTNASSHNTISGLVTDTQDKTYTAILMPDGNVLITGLDGSAGRLDPIIFNIQTKTMSTTTGSAIAGQQVFSLPTSSTVLPNGEIVIGDTGFYNGDTSLEIYSPTTNQWRTLTNAPRNSVSWVIPNGEVLLGTTSYLDPSGDGNVTLAEDASLLSYDALGSNITPNPVMYRPGKLFWAAGNLSNYGADSAAVEFNERAISEKVINSPRSYSVRYSPNTILLPTGNVLSVSALDIEGDARPQDHLEIWNASTESWSLMAGATSGAVSTEVVLLKDGRVLTLVDEKAKTFSPPYLFNSSGDLAERPEVLSAPAEGSYDSQVTVTHGLGNVISRVTLVTAGRSDNEQKSVGQRFIELDFNDVDEGLSVKLPESARTAPPGYYVMYLIDNKGVPSEGHMISLRTSNTSAFPEATNDDITATGSGTITIDALNNDSGSGLILNAPSAWSLEGGNVALIENKITYKPKAGFNGEDKIWYTFDDNQGRSNSGEITITVSGNDSVYIPYPTATADSVTSSGSEITIDALANDTGVSLTLNAPNVWSLKGGNVALVNNKITYKPKAGFNGEDKIWYVFSDDQGRRNSGVITITVSNKTDSKSAYPTASEDNVATTISTATIIDVLINDIGDGLVLNAPNVWSLSGGNVSLKDNKLVYTSKAGFTGDDKIWYTFKDAQGRGNSGQVNITVTADISKENTVASADFFTTPKDTGINLDILSNDKGDSAWIAIDTLYQHTTGGGTAYKTPEGQVWYTPKAGFTGKDGFRYVIIDAEGVKSSAQVEINVTP